MYLITEALITVCLFLALPLYIHIYPSFLLAKVGEVQTFYLVYITDKLFTDDTALGPLLDIVHKCLCQDLSHLLSWIKQSKMRFNTEKSSVMWFQPHALSSTLPPEVQIDGIPLSTSQKYLGITFDNKLD